MTWIKTGLHEFKQITRMQDGLYPGVINETGNLISCMIRIYKMERPIFRWCIFVESMSRLI